MCAGTVGSGELIGVERLRRTHPTAGVLLVSEPSAESLRALADAPALARHVVATVDVSAQLAERVQETLDRHFLERAADTLTALDDVPVAVRDFGRQVWARRPPPRSVARVAEELPFGETTLREAWAAAGFSGRLKEAVDWALLVRAADERREGVTWERAAYAVGTTKERLKRIAGRLGVTGLSDIDENDAMWLEEKNFATWLTRTLPAASVR